KSKNHFRTKSLINTVAASAPGVSRAGVRRPGHSSIARPALLRGRTPDIPPEGARGHSGPGDDTGRGGLGAPEAAPADGGRPEIGESNTVSIKLPYDGVRRAADDLENTRTTV